MQMELRRARRALLKLEPGRRDDVVDERLELGHIDTNLAESHLAASWVDLGDVQSHAQGFVSHTMVEP